MHGQLLNKKIARQYLIEKKPFYDKVKNKQKMFVFGIFFHEISYDSNELDKKCSTIYFSFIKNMFSAF